MPPPLFPPVPCLIESSPALELARVSFFILCSFEHCPCRVIDSFLATLSTALCLTSHHIYLLPMVPLPVSSSHFFPLTPPLFASSSFSFDLCWSDFATTPFLSPYVRIANAPLSSFFERVLAGMSALHTSFIRQIFSFPFSFEGFVVVFLGFWGGFFGRVVSTSRSRNFSLLFSGLEYFYVSVIM